jgi:hypothetical protein
LFGSPVPDPKNSVIPLAIQYRKAMDAARNAYDVFSFEGYIAARLFFETVEGIPELEPGPSELLQQFEMMKNKNFHGMTFNFNKNSRSLATKVWVDTGTEEDWIEMPVD